MVRHDHGALCFSFYLRTMLFLTMVTVALTRMHNRNTCIVQVLLLLLAQTRKGPDDYDGRTVAPGNIGS